VKIIGTSTCDCAITRSGAPGGSPPANGQASRFPASAASSTARSFPVFFGIEAGQSAVGDILNWWVEVVCGGGPVLHDELSRDAATIKPGASGLLALDWNNGNRTILVDPKLTGLLLGQTLHTTRAEIYRALIEATAFGAARSSSGSRNTACRSIASSAVAASPARTICSCRSMRT
jgi:L-ribulokinase